MKRRYVTLIAILFFFNHTFSQEKLFLQKGTIIDSVSIENGAKESFSLYLPTKYNNEAEWPLVLVFETKGKTKQAMAMFREAAEKENYILAASNNVSDTLSISKNVLIAGRMLSKLNEIFPVHKNRVYTAGFFNGGGLANLMPIFFKDIEGVVSSKPSLANLDLLTTKNPFHFIGVIGKEDFNYPGMLAYEKMLNRFKFPNNLIVFEEAKEWPNTKYLQKALHLFTVSAMAKGVALKDSLYVANGYKNDLSLITELQKDKKLLLADRLIGETLETYRTHLNLDSLKSVRKQLRKDKLFRSLKRNQNSAFLKEELLKEDYDYYLEEDLNTYNYNNLGWWNYQMTELNKFIYGDSKSEKQMGKRLYNYINALIEDYDMAIRAEKVADDEALILLAMLKTIVEPKNYQYYLNVISLSSKYEDYGTALFYLEEAFKNDFKNEEKLNALEHAALLRISPEYNKLLDKYLEKARYKITDE